MSIPQIPKKLPKIPAMPAKTGLPGAAKLPGVANSGPKTKLGAASDKVRGATAQVKGAAGEVGGAISGGAQPVAKTSLKDDLKNAAKGGGTTAPGEKQSMRGAGLEVAAKMAKGLSTAAVDGGVGALKAGAVAVLKNKRLRNILITVVAVLVVLQLAAGLGTAAMTLAALSSVAASNSGATQSAVSEAKIGADVIESDVAAGTKFDIPWTLLTSMRKQTATEPDAEALAKTLDVADPSQSYRSMDAGAVYEEGTASRIVLKDSEAHSGAAKSVKDVYVAALSTQPGLDAASAEKVYDRALTWWLGQQQRCGAEASTGDSAGAPVGLTVKGAAMSVEQKVIAKIVIGVTRTAVPGDQATTIRAAEISASVAIVEAAMKNHTVKVDHDSLGVFQQRDTWGTDSQRIRPDWATARFLKALLATPGWNTLPAGEVAQTVQVSAFATRYTEAMPEAKAIVASLWNESPALPLPLDIDMGAGGTPAATDAVLSCVTPTGTWIFPFLGVVTVNDWFSWDGDTCAGCRKHDGVDLGVRSGDPVLSVANGRVLVSSNNDGGCGYYVQIEHDGATMRYCHLIKKSSLAVGDIVTAGQVIGNAGSTGDSGGTHLHFDVTVGGKRVDPVTFMLARGVDFTALPLFGVSPYQG